MIAPVDAALFPLAIVGWQLSTVGKIAVPLIAAWYAKRRFAEWKAAREPDVDWTDPSLSLPSVKLSGCMGEEKWIIKAAIFAMERAGWPVSAMVSACHEMDRVGPEAFVRRWFGVC